MSCRTGSKVEYRRFEEGFGEGGVDIAVEDLYTLVAYAKKRR
jgi:hypothetical protein